MTSITENSSDILKHVQDGLSGKWDEASESLWSSWRFQIAAFSAATATTIFAQNSLQLSIASAVMIFATNDVERRLSRIRYEINEIGDGLLEISGKLCKVSDDAQVQDTSSELWNHGVAINEAVEKLPDSPVKSTFLKLSYNFSKSAAVLAFSFFAINDFMPVLKDLSFHQNLIALTGVFLFRDNLKRLSEPGDRLSLAISDKDSYLKDFDDWENNND